VRHPIIKFYFRNFQFYLIFIFLFFSCLQPATADEHNWLHTARLAGLGLHETITETELEEIIDDYVRQGVNVLECDTSLSDYMDDKGFEKQVEFIRKVVQMGHEKGLKVVWYYPTLESVTPDGLIRDSSMQKDHPDWVQMNFDRKTFNYFYGAKAFWVEPMDESAWLCPNSPYRDYYFRRVEKLAGTGLDGIWFDVPLFNSIVGKWPCADSWCINKFEAETGMKFPQKLDFSDPSFRRWLLWRHQTLADFLKEAHIAAKKVNPEIRSIIEVVSTDHLINTREGLDATFFSPDLDIVWEVDAISDTTSMKDAPLMDWLCMFTAYKFCKGISENRASWAFSYGFRDDDAQLVMASVVAAQCNPYETRIPQMCTSVGQDYRTKMYQWLKTYSDAIFTSKSKAQVAILYSPNTRNLIDGHLDGGFYMSKGKPSPAYRWWVKSPEASLLYANYLSEYRGWAIMMIKNFIPFDILSTNQVTKDELQNYRSIILPRAVSLSDKQKNLFLSYVSGGGKLIITGADSGSYDETGNKRELNIWNDFVQSGNRGANYKKGNVFFINNLPGKEYINSKNTGITQNIRLLLEKADVFPLVQGNADVYVQTYQKDNKTILHLLNYGWVENEDRKAVPVTVDLSIPWARGKKVLNVTQSVPGWKIPKTISFSHEDNRLNFQIETRINSLVIIQADS